MQFLKRSVVCLAVVAMAASGAVNAADKTSASRKSDSWSVVAGWPDFMTGMWAENYSFSAGGAAPASRQPPLTDAAKAQLAKRGKGAEGNGAKCLPLGMPGMMMPGYPMAFFFTRGSIFIMSDMDDLLVRRIFLNRSTHNDPDPSWNGDSVGHWEGGTLVIDTTAINEEAPLAELPSGGNTHIVERIRLTGPNALEWRLTVTNPGLLNGPWEMTKTYVRHADWELQQASCAEGNRDAPADNGASQVDLTPRK